MNQDKPYYLWDGESPIFFETMQQAVDHAGHVIDVYRKIAAVNGWPDDVADIFVAKIAYTAQPAPGTEVGSIDYEMRPLNPKPVQVQPEMNHYVVWPNGMVQNRPCGHTYHSVPSQELVLIATTQDPLKESPFSAPYSYCQLELGRVCEHGFLYTDDLRTAQAWADLHKGPKKERDAIIEYILFSAGKAGSPPIHALAKALERGAHNPLFKLS